MEWTSRWGRILCLVHEKVWAECASISLFTKKLKHGCKKAKSNAACLWDKSVINLRNGQWLLWAELKSSKLLLVWTLDKLFLIRPTHGSIAKLSNYDFIYKLKIYWVIMQWFYYKRSGFNTLLHDNLRAGWKIVQK